MDDEISQIKSKIHLLEDEIRPLQMELLVLKRTLAWKIDLQEISAFKDKVSSVKEPKFFIAVNDYSKSSFLKSQEENKPVEVIIEFNGNCGSNYSFKYHTYNSGYSDPVTVDLKRMEAVSVKSDDPILVSQIKSYIEDLDPIDNGFTAEYIYERYSFKPTELYSGVWQGTETVWIVGLKV